ncbi:hypothetical protein [Thermoleptolyngbya sp.]
MQQICQWGRRGSVFRTDHRISWAERAIARRVDYPKSWQDFQYFYGVTDCGAARQGQE